jgi:hypothetical protein
MGGGGGVKPTTGKFKLKSDYMHEAVRNEQ